MTSYLSEFAHRYHELKLALGDVTGASEELLHVHAGLLIFVLSAIVLQRKMRSPIPLTIVVVFAVLNEIVDVVSHGLPTDLEPLVDFSNTVVWPLILFAIARRWR